MELFFGKWSEKSRKPGLHSIPGSVLSTLIHAYLSLAPAARLTQEALVEALREILPTSLNFVHPAIKAVAR